MENRQLAALYQEAEQLSREYPATLARKIEILTFIQVEIGRRASEAVRDYKRTYAERKKTFAEAYLAASKNREQVAELAVTDLRLREADLEGEKVRWQAAFESNLEVINSLKYSLKVLLAELNTGG